MQKTRHGVQFFLFPFSLFLFNQRVASPKRPFTIFFLWILGGTAAIAVAWTLDASVDAALDAAQSPALNTFAWWCSKLGEGWVPALAGIPLAIAFNVARRPTIGARILFVVLTCELTGLAGLILRIFIGRTRPVADVPQGIYGIWYHGHWIIGKYEFSSFPSGHSATAVGLAAAAWMVNTRWGAVATLYALLVMWSRIALQCHHLSDVVASAVLAIPLAILSKQVLLPMIESFFNSVPASAAGKP
jgi:membrane-associated phospholipid phosphatase